MEEYWIDIEPHFDKGAKKGKDMYCKLTFKDSISVILDDDDVEYVAKVLRRFAKFKNLVKEVNVDGKCHK